MAALTLLLLLAAPLQLELRQCEQAIDAAALRRIVQLEWPDPPAEVRASVRCEDAHWTLSLEAPSVLPASEQYELPALSATARARVVALILSERGRAFVNAPASPPPAPEAPPPLVASVRAPAVHRSDPTSVEEAPALPSSASALRGSLFFVGDRDASTWHLSAAAVALTPVTGGPWRFGPEVRAQGGPFSVAVQATVGTARVDFGTAVLWTLTLEPELTVLCAGSARWRVCAAARGIIGYGALTAGDPPSAVEGKHFESPLLGGAGVLTASLRLLTWLALEADGRLGATWDVFGNQGANTIAAVGGSFCAVSLGLVASWGGR